MHVLKHSKKEKAKPLVPIISQFKVPGIRRMRGRRYNTRGQDIGPCGPPKPIPDVGEQKNLARAEREAAALPPPVEGGDFSLDRYRPMPGKVLLKRPPQITERGGVKLPETKYESESWFFVVKVGDRVTVCQPGDRVVFDKRGKPKAVRLGGPFHLGKAKSIISLIES